MVHSDRPPYVVRVPLVHFASCYKNALFSLLKLLEARSCFSQHHVVADHSCSLPAQAAPTERHKVVIADGMAPSTSGTSYLGGEDDERKYIRRAHPLKRSLQRLFPGLFAPGLPVTMR